MARRKVRKPKVEAILYTVAIISAFGLVISKVFLGASMTYLNMKISSIDYKIAAQEKQNESLTMKVNELTSFDKVKTVVSDMGLAYNNDNIIIIND